MPIIWLSIIRLIMGCNCKKTYHKMSEYADNREEIEAARQQAKGLSISSAFKSIGLGISQFVFGLIAIVVMLVFVVPLLLYVMFCLLFGKEPSIRIIDLNKRLRKNREQS